MRKSPFNWVLIGFIAYLVLAASDLGHSLPGSQMVRCTGPVLASTHSAEEREASCK